MGTKKRTGKAFDGHQFLAQPLKILASTAQILHKLLSNRHFLHPASYRAGLRGPLAPPAYPPRPPRAWAEVACVGKANTSQTLCIRWTALTSAHSRKPITQLLRFIRPAR